MSLAEQQVPAVSSWLGTQVDSFVQKQNLTEVGDSEPCCFIVLAIPCRIRLKIWHHHSSIAAAEHPPTSPMHKLCGLTPYS